MGTEKLLKPRTYRKLYIVQCYGYIAFIPFLFAFFTLIKERNKVDMVIFFLTLGALVIVILINHITPVLKISSNNIIIYNTFRNRPTRLSKKGIQSIYKVNKTESIINHYGTTYVIKLNRKNMEEFIYIIKELI